jgi:hypothetical protein
MQFRLKPPAKVQQPHSKLRGAFARFAAWTAAALLLVAHAATGAPRPVVKVPEPEPVAEIAIPKARVVSLPRALDTPADAPKKPIPAPLKAKPVQATAKAKPPVKVRLGDEQWFGAAATVDPVAEIAVPLTALVRKTAVTAESVQGLSVLILGDSLSLCGFGERLDSRFRKSPQFRSIFTYMTCGTVPLSWLKVGGYTNAKTCCGYFSIESDEDGGAPKKLDDSIGSKRGVKPKSHAVPKIEDLLEQTKPDILIVQTGTNFYGFFPDGESISEDRHDKMLKSHIVPFMREVLATHSSLRKIYWVASPTSGRVSEGIQDFVFERCCKFTAPVATVIDSRTLIHYPFTAMQSDNEHFGGADMNRWADRVFERVMSDLTFQPLPPVITAQIPVEEKPPVAPPAEDESALVVKARLTFKSPPLRPEQFVPYQESLVAYVYDVVKVVKGEYQEKQILVMHPAHIRRQAQSLGRYKVGDTYDLRLRDIDGTPWVSIKSSDQSGHAELLPYIQVADDRKFPSRGK